jgi:UDP-glucuronate decarboxylase
MKVLVTGGAGFIGSHLCDRLISEGYDVVCMDDLSTGSYSNIKHLEGNPKFTFLNHDVCKPWSIGCDRIFHLACPASPVQYQRNRVRTIKTAFLGTLHALECARDACARLVVSSTSEVYGDPEVHPQKEDYSGNVNPVGPRSCYDEGKRAAESLIYSWIIQYSTDVRVARIFNTYGPRLAIDDGRVISNFTCQLLRNKPLTIYGDGLQTRSLCYISDMVEGLIRLMMVLRSDALNTPINLGNPDERSVLYIADYISGLIRTENSRVESIEFRPLPQDDPRKRKPDITKATKILGWEPRVDFETGMNATVDWFQLTLTSKCKICNELISEGHDLCGTCIDDKMGSCEYCHKRIPSRYGCCAGCADERGP